MAEDDYDGPSDQDIEDSYASTWLSFQNELGRERFRTWLAAHDACVRRDAAREALDGLAAQEAEHERLYGDPGIGIHSMIREAAEDYRDTHYPEDVTP